MRHGWTALVLVWALGCASTGATGASLQGATECLDGEAWREADALFVRDRRFRGGDAAYSVDLGGDRSLWLFGDSFLAPHEVNRRKGLGMVRNSVAIMHGRDPQTARLEFSVPVDASGAPRAFFEGRDERWYWPGHGVRDGDTLLLFLHRMGPSATTEGRGFDFAFEQSEVVRVTNPDAAPAEWKLEWLTLDESVHGLAVGAGVLIDAEHIYAYAVAPSPPHDVYLLRWPRAALHETRLPAPEAWTGSGFGRGPPARVVRDAAMELSAHGDAATGEIVLVYSHGFGAAPIVAQRAPRPEGPFGAAVPLFRPSVRPMQLSYAGKAHPQLMGAPLTVSHVVNSTDGSAVLWDERIYYPKLIRVTPGRCAGR